MYLTLGRVNNSTPVQRDYARTHGVIEDQGYFLIPFKCPHLQRSDAGMGETEYRCDIYEDRPKLCKEFDGRHYKNHHIYWVPKECSLAKSEQTLGDVHARLSHTDKKVVSKTPS